MVKIELELTDEDYKMFFKPSVLSAYIHSEGIERSFHEYILKLLEEQEENDQS